MGTRIKKDRRALRRLCKMHKDRPGDPGPRRAIIVLAGKQAGLRTRHRRAMQRILGGALGVAAEGGAR
jgi:hypothetical protein